MIQSLSRKGNCSTPVHSFIGYEWNKLYYFEPTLAFEAFWVDFMSIDFAKGTPERKLTLTGGERYSGNAAAKFLPTSKPFHFLFGA